MAGEGQAPEYLDEHHQRIAEFAADYLDEDEGPEFVDGMLERLGYQRATHWTPPEPEQGGDGSQGGRRQPLVKQQRQASGGGQGGGRRGGYGTHFKQR